VPYAGAWKHAVEPLCELHYPPDRPRLWTSGWPGPATPTKASSKAAKGGPADESHSLTRP